MNKQERRVIRLELNREERVIAAIERQYRNALRDIDDRIRILQSDELTQSRIYQIQYQRALRGQVAGILDKLHGDQYATIQQYLHDSYQDGFIGTMYSLHGQGIPLVVPLDQDAAVKAILTDSKIREGLYESLGVDVKALKKAISSEITRGIASNLPFADIARNIANRTRAPLGRAKTIVRTESHRIQQAAADDARNAAKERGCDVVKQWDGTLDGDTRPTHRRLDGQIRETEEPFEMDGKTAMYPGDFGKPEEDCNCRCVALTRAKWALDEDELKQLKERAEYFGLDKTEEFDKFEEKYLRAAAEVPRVKPEEEPERTPEKTPEPLINQEESGIIEPGEVLDKYDRKAQYTHWTEDLKATNPNYNQGAEYQNNCQRCVASYELRRRGYKVRAKPAMVTADGKLSPNDTVAAQWFTGLFKDIQWYALPTNNENGIAALEAMMKTWGDGARAEVYVAWENGGAHVFVAEQANGKTYFFDPQTGSNNCRGHFANALEGRTMFARIDNLSVTDAIDGFVENER